jgi:TorA maturation chaperone TorD
MKRTEGRAPVWGSEYTTKDATLQGDSDVFAAGWLKRKFWDLRRGDW